MPTTSRSRENGCNAISLIMADEAQRFVQLDQRVRCVAVTIGARGADDTAQRGADQECVAARCHGEYHTLADRPSQRSA